MQQLNITFLGSIPDAYQQGLLPQRNQKDLYYRDSSCRSDLSRFSLSSENRRIIRKTENFTFKSIPLSDFDFNVEVQKQCYRWTKAQNWDFPSSSIKTIFTNHIFNTVYVWYQGNEVVAYTIGYFDKSISHIAYVFYNPRLAHGNLPIRLSLQFIIDSHQLGLKYCYLGRFSPETGFYKRNMPGFEHYYHQSWVPYYK